MTKTKQKSIFTPERTFKFFIINSIALWVAAIIIWPLLDMLFCAIEQRPFIWTINEHLISPLIFALVFTTIEFICWNFFHKPTKK